MVTKLEGRDVLLVYGGIRLDEGSQQGKSSRLAMLPRGTTYGGIWQLDLGSNVWKQLPSEGTTTPTPRQGHVAWIYKHYMVGILPSHLFC